MKYSDEASDTEQQLMRAPFVRNSADMGNLVAVIVILLALVAMALVYVVSNR